MIEKVKCNMTPLRISQCRISDAQVTVKACGPLVSLNRQILQIGGTHQMMQTDVYLSSSQYGSTAVSGKLLIYSFLNDI